jgi:hypothetical protein
MERKESLHLVAELTCEETKNASKVASKNPEDIPENDEEKRLLSYLWICLLGARTEF